MNDSRLKLSLLGENAFCFNADDYMKIRTEHRIVGRLVGSNVKWPRNIHLNGLPAIYSPYETQLLIDKRIIQLCKKSFSDIPNEALDRLYEERCAEQAESFNEIYIEKRMDEANKLMSRILDGKRKKVAKGGGDPNLVTEESILDDIRKRAIEDATSIYTQIPTQEPFDIVYEVVTAVPKLNPLKYRVFCDLWKRGNFITSGATFGGDFLIYPSEPLHFHASHIVHVLSGDEAKAMTTRTFITRTRLSVNVNKLCTFAYENEENNELCYQTAKWLGK